MRIPFFKRLRLDGVHPPDLATSVIVILSASRAVFILSDNISYVLILVFLYGGSNEEL